MPILEPMNIEETLSILTLHTKALSLGAPLGKKYVAGLIWNPTQVYIVNRSRA